MERRRCPFKDGKLCDYDCMFFIGVCVIKESMLHGMGFWDKPQQQEESRHEKR